MQHNDDASLGACLEHWSRMLDAEKDMLFRRMCLLVDYEQSNRSLEKAKVSTLIISSESYRLSFPSLANQARPG